MTMYKHAPLSPQNFVFMQELALEDVGIEISGQKEKTDVFYNKIYRRLHDLNLHDCNTYCDLIKNDSLEREKFINIITNQSTYFFREEEHFRFLKKYLQTLSGQKRAIGILSAGCSTGEEPYSIAMVVLEAISEVETHEIRVIGIDVNTESLLTAEAGIYATSGIEAIPKHMQHRFLLKGVRDNVGFVKVHADVRKLVHFHYQNLIEEFSLGRKFDVIFWDVWRGRCCYDCTKGSCQAELSCLGNQSLCVI